MSSNQKFTPPQYVERKRKVKTEQGSYIKDESYYSDPYWTYYIQTSVVAELTSPKGEKKFFHANDNISYSIYGQYRSVIDRAKYVESIQNNLNQLFKQIANEVAPEGLVVSKKVSIKGKNDLIFLINMGKNEGLYESQKVIVYKETIFKDEIEAKTITTKVRIGTATVSNQIMDSYAWIVMDDDDHNHVIEVGDLIQPRY
jgi:translation initiation factor 2 beta subunit (eIF-2beta)/eIF-5